MPYPRLQYNTLSIHIEVPLDHSDRETIMERWYIGTNVNFLSARRSHLLLLIQTFLGDKISANAA
jgi:hypothetical protein